MAVRTGSPSGIRLCIWRDNTRGIAFCSTPYKTKGNIRPRNPLVTLLTTSTASRSMCWPDQWPTRSLNYANSSYLLALRERPRGIRGSAHSQLLVCPAKDCILRLGIMCSRARVQLWRFSFVVARKMATFFCLETSALRRTEQPPAWLCCGNIHCS